MKINKSTVGYSVKQGIKNIRRNKVFSLASIGTIATCLFLFGIFFFIILNLQAIMKEAESSVAITIFFDEGLEENKIKEIGEQIKKRKEVKDINFVSADEAWEKFSEEYFDGKEEVLEGFGKDNPLKNSACYEIHINDIKKQNEVIKFLKKIDGVRKVNSSNVIADNFASLNTLTAYSSIAIISILLLVAIFLISNTISTGIAVRKEEIAIMKLIGATDFFVKAPFIVEGIIIGVIGSILPIGILYIIYQEAIEYIMSRFHVLGEVMKFLPVGGVFSKLIPLCFTIGIGIGVMGSFITIRRHLRV